MLRWILIMATILEESKHGKRLKLAIATEWGFWFRSDRSHSTYWTFFPSSYCSYSILWRKKCMCWVQISKTDLLTIFTFVSVKLVRRLSQMFVRMIVWIDRLSYLSITQFTSDLDHSPYPGILNRTRFASAGITCRRHISVICYKTKNIFQTFCDV